MGVLAAGGRLGAISAQFVNGSLEKNIPLLLFVTSACTVAGGLIAWLLPYDNTGTPLPTSDGEENELTEYNVIRYSAEIMTPSSADDHREQQQQQLHHRNNTHSDEKVSSSSPMNANSSSSSGAHNKSFHFMSNSSNNRDNSTYSPLPPA